MVFLVDRMFFGRHGETPGGPMGMSRQPPRAGLRIFFDVNEC